MKRKRMWLVATVVMIAILLISSLAVGVIWSRKEKGERFNRAYEEIKVGDSRQVVVAALGEPSKITVCSYTPFNDPKKEAEFRAKCFQQFDYSSFMGRRSIYFDQSGLVIAKTSAVSP